MRIHPAVTVLACALLLSACSSAESDWKKADSQNTAAAYEDFLKQHATDSHAAEARSRLQTLQDSQAWSDALSANTTDSLQAYLQRFPSGVHANDARTQLTTLQRADDWKSAQAANTPAALQGFLQKYSSGPEVELAKAQLQKLEGYRVQVAALASAKAAEETRTRLQSKYSNELPKLVVLAPSGAEKLHRVSSEPMTEEDAKAACGKLRKSHQHCEVVKS